MRLCFSYFAQHPTMTFHCNIRCLILELNTGKTLVINKVIVDTNEESEKSIIVGRWNSTELYQYSIKNQLWTQLIGIEIKDDCADMFEIDENFYTVSSTGDITSFSENKIYKFPSNVSSRFLHQCKIGNKILILHGSWPSEPIIDSKIFDSKTCVWKELKIEVKRRNFSAVEYMGMVWILGGIRTEINQRGSTNSIEIYDPIMDTMKPSPIKMLCNRSQHSSIVYKGKLYVFGGYDVDSSFGHLKSVEMYSPKSNKFVMMAPMKRAHSNFGCCRIKNLVYIIDGSCYNDCSMEIYNLDADTWLEGVDFPLSCSPGFRACALKYELSDSVVMYNTEMEVVEAPKQNKPYSFFNIFQTEK